MKKIKTITIILSMIFLGGIFAFKSISLDQSFLPTKMKITIIDGLGNINEGAVVTLYETEKDYRASENHVRRDTTDKKGRVKFIDLKPTSYYLDARNGDMNNNGEGVKTAALVEGKINKVNVVIE